MTHRRHHSRRAVAGLHAAGAMQPVAVGETPYRLSTRTERADLKHYGSGDGIPLILVYSLVNRAYLLDLRPDRSVVKTLVALGIDPYVLDWRTPDSMSSHIGLLEHLEEDIGVAIEAVTREHGEAPHLGGVCQGGVLALCQAARAPATVRSLTLLATPIDFLTANDNLARLARHVDFEQLVRASGNVPATGLNMIFAGLKPVELLFQRYRALSEIADDDAALRDFLRMERWMYDSPDQAGRAFLEFARECYQHNGLLEGTLTLDGERISPNRFPAPVFAAYASADHLVPAEAAAAIRHLVRPERLHMQSLPGGHLGLFIGGNAHRQLYPALADWLRNL